LSQAVRTRQRSRARAPVAGLPARVDGAYRAVAAAAARVRAMIDAGVKRYLPYMWAPRPAADDPVSVIAASSGFPPWSRAAFAVIVLLPTVVAALYFFLIASNQYVAEARFAVRGATQKLPSVGVGGRFGGGAISTLIEMNSNQEAFIVVNYIQSGRIIEDLRGELDVRAIFRWPAGDFLAAFAPDGTQEQFARYWRTMVSASVEPVSGIAIVRVTTFSPAESLRLANAILASCERLVNEFVNRVRVDTLQRSEDDLRRAGRRVAAARSALREFRERYGFIDPSGSARSLFDTILKLRQERITADTDLAAARSQLGEASARIRELQARVNILDDQIRKLEAQLTRPEDNDPRKASEAIRAYELLLFDAKMADDVFMLAETALTDARTNLAKHHVYLETYVRPTLPEDALYPRPLLATFAVLAGTFMLWAISVLAAAGLRDHVD
jgi:capsular polysaccharide transport system permease protein